MALTTTTYEFNVDMACEACSNAVKRSLNKTYANELASVEADLTTQRVKIVIQREDQQPYTTDQVYAALSKCGKTVRKLD